MRWPVPENVNAQKYENVQKEVYYAFLENTWNGIEHHCCPGWFAIAGYFNPEGTLLDIQEYIYNQTGIKVNKDFIWRASADDLVRHIYDLIDIKGTVRDLRVKRNCK